MISSIQASNFLDQKFKIPFLGNPKIKEVSEDPICVDQDTTAKVAAYKAPKVKIASLLDVSNRLVIHTDLLVINGGYITKPKEWDIQADKVRLVNCKQSQWIASLIQDGSIHKANFKSIQDPDCNFDIPAKPTAEERLNDIKDEIKDFKERFFRL